MSASSTVQKGFIFLLIIWTSSFASGNTSTNDLQFLLGSRAVIPCQHDQSESFKWFYKKDECSEKIQIFFQNKAGMRYHKKITHPRVRVLHNSSLVIENLTVEDRGDYWCEKCFQDSCQNTKHTVTSVKTVTVEEPQKTFFVAAGNSFNHSCQHELTNLKWTFEASNVTSLRNSPEANFVTSKKALQIVNIKRADAGKYTCWKNICNGHWQKLLTINLCVIAVDHREDSSIYCAVMCDMKFSNMALNSTLKMETDTSAITVFVDQFGSLHCSATQTFDEYTTVHTTRGQSKNTTGTPTQRENLIPVIFGASAALTCLILITLVICYLQQRLGAVFPSCSYCSGLNGRQVDEESSVVYSSVIIRKPAETLNNDMTHIVYSEIKL